MQVTREDESRGEEDSHHMQGFLRECYEKRQKSRAEVFPKFHERHILLLGYG
jgi:hypothetical protein